MNEEMRDARLKKALENAPDADARPADAVREAILHKARLTAAAAAAPPRPARWWDFSRPWNSGLATVGLIAFVGLLVWSQDLLKQAAETGPAVETRSAPVPVPAPSTAAVPTEATEAPPAPEARLRPAPKTSRVAPTAAPQVSVEVEAKTAAPALAAAPPPPPPAPPPPMPAPVRETEPPPAAVVMAVPMQAPAPAPMAALRQRENSLAAASAMAPAGAAWTAVRVLRPGGGPVFVLARDALDASTQILLGQQLAAPRVAPRAAASAGLQVNLADHAAEPGALQIELMAGERSLGRYELGAGELRQQLERAITRPPSP